MFYRKKIAAFIAGLLICAYAAVPTLNSFAEGEAEPDTTAASETADSYTISGDFMYSLTHDGNACIEDCTSTAEDLVIPDTLDGIPVTELGRTAFGSDHENNSFRTVTLPASVSYISADNPFMYCTKLREVRVAEGSADFIAEDGILYSKDKTELVCYPSCKEGTSYTIPDSVKNIRASAFYSTELSEIKISSALETIGYFAFADTKLTSADLSGTKLTEIGDYAFSYCNALSEVKLPDTLETIGGGAFGGCSGIKEITLPEKLKKIGQYAFYDTGLTEVVVPPTVESIGYCAFGYYSDANGSATPNSSFTIIGNAGSAAYAYAFDKDSDYDYQNSFNFLTPEQYEEEQAEILALNSKRSGDYEYSVTDDGAILTFCYSQDDVITVPDTIEGNKITSIYTACFSESQASEIILPEGITEIKKLAFYKCGSLRTITIPASVKTIGDNAFDGCTALESVEFLGTETIGSLIFCDCTALRTVKADGCLKEWNDDEPFIFCTALEEIVITEGDGNYSSENGVMYNKDKSVLVAYPAAKPDTAFVAPAGVKEIAQSAFAKAMYLENVEIPEADVINACAFEGCHSLKSAKLSETITTIGADAFYGCTSLKSLRLPDTLINIGAYAFGFYHDDSADTSDGGTADALIEGFKLYAPKDSAAYEYAKSSGIEVITGTTEIFGKNITTGFLYTVIGIIAAAVLGLIGFVTGKKIKKSKAERAQAEKREKAAEQRKQRSEEENEDTDEEDDSLEDKD